MKRCRYCKRIIWPFFQVRFVKRDTSNDGDHWYFHWDCKDA